YEYSCQRGRQYVSDLGVGISELSATKNELSAYKAKVQQTQSDLGLLRDNISGIEKLTPESISTPIRVYNKPTYVPKDAFGIGNFSQLQTIFPRMYLLVVMFLSLLISSFITLDTINSSSNLRISILSGMFFHQYLATYFSSLIIVSLPIFIVLGLGQILFDLHIIANFFWIAMLSFLLSSVFILIGMFLSYLIRKESTTLVITTFTLLALIFISGFIFPIERMSLLVRIFSFLSPGRIAMEAFSKLVFYSQVDIAMHIIMLLCWGVILTFTTMITKLLRD
ncbi:MAG: ABC transporter permease, partial [Nanoarchaeota archaeon]|nr:ABC transporter permease [Nanoarchaeota archaeon]